MARTAFSPRQRSFLRRSLKLEWISRASLALLFARRPCGDASRCKSRLQVFEGPSSTDRHSPRRRPIGIVHRRCTHGCGLQLHPGSDLHDAVAATLGGAAEETSRCASPGLTSLHWVPIGQRTSELLRRSLRTQASRRGFPLRKASRGSPCSASASASGER